MRVNLKLLRVKRGLNQGEMATRLGVNRATYCHIESGKSNGSMKFWLALKREFPEVDIDEMLKTEERARR